MKDFFVDNNFIIGNIFFYYIVIVVAMFAGMNDRIREVNGGFEVPKRAKFRYVKRIVPHANYDSSLKPTYDYDIALLELQTPFNLDPYIRTVCLPPSTNCELLNVFQYKITQFLTNVKKIKLSLMCMNISACV